ncbi:hypothetical protein CFBP4996_15340 [Agrobacterium leguminum]|uniref:Uncharacterized protein n=1 Tax=Agrobacterium deltaense NCPPB 1641 TaxID=1183425 RepID=A0A1S7U2B8_9HYPH|nr:MULTISPECIES: hypothetical protein [Agrobacterium]WFS67401.1 hypothetical protein CFBP4996_15340 [Agrobacterium leguminum]CVI61023.1 conserved hypothetical protein [Agrobacterium deltaense NCPPB 1641]
MIDENTFNDAKLGDMFITSDRYVVVDDDDELIVMTKIGDQIKIDHYAKNLQAIFDQNAEEAAAFSRTGKLGSQVKVASIPTTLYNHWKKLGIMDDNRLLKRKLNDSDYSKFRTNTLKV